MDVSIPYLRSQADLLTEIKVKTRLGSTARWSDAEYYNALNEVLYTWAEQVKLPHIYTITDGWLANEYEYALPSYIRPPIFPEMLRRVPHVDYVTNSLTTRWQELPGWELLSDGAGGQVIRLSAPPRTMEAQVGFYAPNSRVPLTIPVTSGSTSATATTMLISTAIDIDDVGYVKCEAEWIGYAGVTRGATTTTLNNLVRALYGTTAAIHNTASSVTWGVAMDDMRLLKLLFDQWKSYLHAYFIQDGGTHEVSRHEKGMGYYDSLALMFWPTYRPKRQASGIKLNHKVFAIR